MSIATAMVIDFLQSKINETVVKNRVHTTSLKLVDPMPKGNPSSSGKNGGKSNGGTTTRGNSGSSRRGGKQESYGPSWLNKDGSVDPVKFAQREVGYFAPGHDHFDEKFNHACAMYGFKPWEMWSGNS